MQKVGKILKTNIKKYKIEEKLKTYEVLRGWEKIIADFLPEAKGKTMAMSLEKGVLKIASLTRELADLIYILAKRIIDLINQLVGKRVVFKISCVV